MNYFSKNQEGYIKTGWNEKVFSDVAAD